MGNAHSKTVAANKKPESGMAVQRTGLVFRGAFDDPAAVISSISIPAKNNRATPLCTDMAVMVSASSCFISDIVSPFISFRQFRIIRPH